MHLCYLDVDNITPVHLRAIAGNRTGATVQEGNRKPDLERHDLLETRETRLDFRPGQPPDAIHAEVLDVE